uniref:AlNc14C312G10496 protein n=1 Tax=Albugo laibachii Nc14 TaxID=890382 RepID=F0WW52_9STRA|nr:AlNc14C312G10496 [Albugo laibachii Nc14]|eukprot:CCA25670.1 AlNc14C312G10496 [Albugo laibachii Nc14]
MIAEDCINSNDYESHEPSCLSAFELPNPVCEYDTTLTMRRNSKPKKKPAFEFDLNMLRPPEPEYESYHDSMESHTSIRNKEPTDDTPSHNYDTSSTVIQYSMNDETGQFECFACLAFHGKVFLISI